MRIVRLEKREGVVEVIPEDREDLWLLSTLILPGDDVEGIATRRVKREGERGPGRVFTFKVRLRVEDVEFTGHSLRIKGIVVEGPEDIVGKGKYQSLEVREGDRLRVFKPIDDHMVEELRRAEEEARHPPVLVVAVSDEDAYLATYTRRLGKPRVLRRGGDEDLGSFLGRVRRAVEEAEEGIVVVGGPAVVLDSVKRGWNTDKRLLFVVTPLTGEKALRDIVAKRGAEVVLGERRKRVREALEDFLAHLAKGDGLATLRPEGDAEIGNISLLLVHEDWINGHRKEAYELMKRVREVGGEVFVVTEDVEGSEIVKKLGGKIGIRRFRVPS